METIYTDVLVIGGGGAGSRAAYEAKRFAKELKVALVVGGAYGASGSTCFVGSETLGINAPLGCADPTDSPEVYLEDMIDTGLGVANENLCRIIAYESGDRIRDLIALGMRFDCKDGRLMQRKLSGCTKARSLSFGGQTGVEIVRTLKKANKELGVDIYEHTRAVDLITHEDRVVGAVCLRKDGTPVAIMAKAVVLACGGAGRLFQRNINPPGVAGDGFAMAYRAGAALTNMEFIQVGPGVVYPNIRFIIHSHMWRFVPTITNRNGDRFLPEYCPPDVTYDEVLDLKAMSYPFSVRTDSKYLDISIFKEMLAGRGTAHGGVYFDVTHIAREELKAKAPITYETFLSQGVDLATDKIEIAPVVQSFNGGVKIDENGASSVPGLYCAGEVSGGVHGADRPGGNNLIDCQVFGYRAGQSAAREAAGSSYTCKMRGIRLEEREYSEGDTSLLSDLCRLYYRNLTIVRTEEGIKEVLTRIDELKEQIFSTQHFSKHIALANALIVGEIVAKSALIRRESRGTHYRDDYPVSDEKYLSNTVVRKGDDQHAHVEWSRGQDS
jgi:fumarate reductase (CoM/CoB) subunit A